MLKYRWLGAITGLLIGLFDLWIAQLLKVEFLVEGKDIAFYIFLYLAQSFGVFGWVVGRLMESLRSERAARSEAKARTEEIAETRVRLAQTEKLASLGQLASAIAHEVRNPLAIIRSSVQNIAEGPLDEASSKSCRFVMEEIDRLTRVTSALLGFAKPMAVRRAPVSAREILNRADMIGQKVCEAHALRWSRIDPAKEATVDADRDLLCQALIGMLDNAAELTPRGGSITLEANTDGEEVTFAVSDTGPGVPPENRGKIFEPFFSTRPGGHGLGLAVVRQIVEAHGGKIEVGEGSGGGARFVIRLPRLAAA